MEARHFLAVELQEGCVRSAGHVWVHVPDSLAQTAGSEPEQACVVKIEPVLRTLSVQSGQITRQVFRAHNGIWGQEIRTKLLTNG